MLFHTCPGVTKLAYLKCSLNYTRENEDLCTLPSIRKESE